MAGPTTRAAVVLAIALAGAIWGNAPSGVARFDGGKCPNF